MKYVLSNMGRGFLYTIGRILAFIFIGLVIATLVSKIDIALTFLSQLVDLIVPLIALYILFDFIGMLLFGRR